MFPRGEIEGGEILTQLSFAVDAQLGAHFADMGVDGGDRYPQALTDLTVSISQAAQGNHILLARSEITPTEHLEFHTVLLIDGHRKQIGGDGLLAPLLFLGQVPELFEHRPANEDKTVVQNPLQELPERHSASFESRIRTYILLYAGFVPAMVVGGFFTENLDGRDDRTGVSWLVAVDFCPRRYFAHGIGYLFRPITFG
jgi:hypothetical protein